MARTVLVTGGNRGIGLATAKAFATQGHRVAIGRRGSLDQAEETGLLQVACDVNDPASVDAAFTAVEQKRGAVEVLVANAGITDDALLLRMNEKQFTQVVDTDLTGTWRCARRAMARMPAARWGRMIFMSSSATMIGNAGQANYAANKAGIVGLARTLTREIGAQGITVNVVAPGFVETDMTAAMSTEQRAVYAQATPVGRFAAPNEVADVVTWLASDSAGYISGAIIPVDGGLGMGH